MHQKTNKQAKKDPTMTLYMQYKNQAWLKAKSRLKKYLPLLIFVLIGGNNH